MNGIFTFVRRHPLAVFVVLTYVLSWWPSLLYGWGLSPIGVAAFGPFLAALIVLGMTEGTAGVKTLLRRMVHWRVGWQWWLVALVLPILMSGIASYLTVVMGAPAPSAVQLAAWPAIFATFVLRLLVPGRNPVGEATPSTGWRWGAHACGRCCRSGSSSWSGTSRYFSPGMPNGSIF